MLNTKPLDEIDYAAFAEDLENLKKEIDSNISEKDFKHLRKLELWGKLCTFAGYLTSCFMINPVSAFLISQGNITRWGMVTHHISHRGYDRVPGIKKRYTSSYYARGKRRFLDWPEWMHPDAWALEHNLLHHYHTGEKADPDFAQQNVEILRNAKIPVFMKYLVVFFFMAHWKLSYYAPNTFWFLRKSKQRKGKLKELHSEHAKKSILYPGAYVFLPISKDGLLFWLNCVLPYTTYRFGLIPLLFLPFGKTAWFYVLINSILAEIITNIHSFLIIVPNHTGEDVPCFEGNPSGKAEFYVRQAAGSVNYTGSSNIAGFFQGWLNYQIEHHLWPDIPMLKYQQYQPRVEEICKKHGVPYIKESVFKRFKKLLDLLVGKTSMQVAETKKGKAPLKSNSDFLQVMEN